MGGAIGRDRGVHLCPRNDEAGEMGFAHLVVVRDRVTEGNAWIC